MLRTLSRSAVLALSFLLAASGASVAQAQEAPIAPPPTVVIGDVPAEGGMALLIVGADTTAEGFVEVLRSAGCEAEVVAITSGGAFQLYAPAAPPFANASFPASLEAGRGVLVRCAEPTVVDAHLLRLVSKDRPLPEGFVPQGLTLLPSELVMPGGGPAYLTEEAADALAQLIEAGDRAGQELRVRSAYRSYAEQVATYQYWVDVLGEVEANRRSAVPGHSEHQLGVVADVTSASVGWELEPEFGETPEGRWLKQHAWEFGFVESYPQEAEAITGYDYEPWHIRYVGKTHADWIRLTGLTLTEYLAQVDVDLD